MKSKLITIITLILPLAVFPQSTGLVDTIVPVNEEGLIEYKEVFNVEGTAAELYERALDWADDYFANPSGVFRKKDAENAILEGNIRFRISELDRKGNRTTMYFVIHFDFTFEFREGRYRVILEDFTRQSTSDYPLERWIDPQGSYYDAKNLDYLKQIDEQVREMLTSLEQAMQPKVEKPDEW